MKLVFMVLLVILAFSLVNYYIGIRTLIFIRSFNFKINITVFWIIFGIISMSFIISRLTEKFLPDFLGKAIDLIGSYWLAVMLYFIIILLILDIFRVINRKFNFTRYIGITPNNSGYIAAIIVFAALALILAYGTYNGRHVVVSNYEVTVPKKAGEIRDLNVVMVSDIHIGALIHNSRVISMVDKINSLKPDVVLIAGDVIDNNIDFFMKENIAKTFGGLKAHLGVYAVLGNHDIMSGHTDELISEFKKVGVETLVDDRIKVANSFYIIGRNDLASERESKKKRMTLDDLVKGVDKTLPIILMDHQPYHLEDSENIGIDIQFSGHTHRGQLFPSELITSRIYEIDWGYLKKGNLNTYVSSGYGTWGPPIRLGSKSEIVNVKVHFTK